jgi:predicted RecA/RadA family phage recombinase
MAANFIQEGNVIDWYNAGAAVASGDPVRVGYRGMGVALAAIGALGTGSVMVDGVFDFPLDVAATTAIGGMAYWDATDEEVYNAADMDRSFIGFFTETRSALAGQTVGVKLAPFASEGQRVVTAAAEGAQTLSAAAAYSGKCTVLVPNTAALTLTLPSVAAIPVGAEICVIKTSAATEIITLDGAGDEAIPAAVDTEIDAISNRALLVSSGSAWVLADSSV